TEHFAVRVEQSGETGGGDGQGDGGRFADQRGLQRLRGDIHHHALTELQRIEIPTVALNRQLVVRAAIGVIEDGLRHAPLRELAQIRYGIHDGHAALDGRYFPQEGRRWYRRVTASVQQR